MTVMESINYDAQIQIMRRDEFPQISGTTYLDHAGTTLHARTLVDRFCEDMKTNLFGNPHSASPSSDLSTQRIERVRRAVLDYFNADPECFDVVFVANATAAVKLVMHSLQTHGFWYGYHKDAHTSLVGVREIANQSRCFGSDQEVENWIEDGDTEETTWPSSENKVGLFAYPAQSNMTGHRSPYSWSRRIRSSHPNCYVLLDAASYLTTGRLDLHEYDSAPDFIALSFYKIFGFPDLGALLVRKNAFTILTSRKYFGGGTVDMIIDIDDDWHAMKSENLHDVLEDGTLPFHNIVALEHALTVHKRLFGTASQIARHVSFLSSWLFEELRALRHHNSKSVVVFHKEEHSSYADPLTQGPILAFSVLSADGQYIGQSSFEMLAIACGIQLRTGGVCNPGGIASMLHLKSWELRRNYCEGARCGNEIDVVGGKPTGIIRVSLGAMSTLTDVQVLAHFVRFFFVGAPMRNSDWPQKLRSLASDTALQTHGGTSGLGNREDPPLSRAIPDTITPIQGCEPFHLPRVRGKTTKEVYESFATWNHQWRMVDPTNGQPLSSSRTRERVRGLRIKINPQAGILCMSIDKVRPPLRDQSAAEANTELEIDLWTVPPRSEDGLHPSVLEESWDMYIEPQISEWLTKVLGFPATLARRRGLNFRQKQQANRCVVSRCQMQCLNQSDLKWHYAVIHDKEFGDVLRAENSKTQHRPQPYQAPIFGLFMLRKSVAAPQSYPSHKQKQPISLSRVFNRRRGGGLS